MNKLEEIQLTLENEGDFYREYLSITNGKATSAGASRRSLIHSWIGKRNLPTVDVTERVKLEAYFNDKWDLCPYGLESTAEVAQRKLNQQIRKVCDDTDTLINQKKEENIMSFTPNADQTIQTVTFVNGKPAESMTDEQIFFAIADVEKEIKKLEAIEHKPKKLEAKIASLKADIAALTALVDNR